MLKPPYTHYSRIYTYHIDRAGLPAVNDADLIGSWEEDGKSILVFHTAKDALVQELCRQNSCRLFYQADLDYNDWEMGREVVPFTVGSLTIAPVWSQVAADIRIDPSIVFGNGFHPSTRLCLETLVNWQPKLPRGFTALDLGCGSGLLAIAAAKLGASSVVAADHNRLACAVAEQNALYNKVCDRVRIKEVDLRKIIPATAVDVLMANLHQELLVALFRTTSFWRARFYILSGFMAGGEEELLASLPTPTPLLLERRRLDKWRQWVLCPR